MAEPRKFDCIDCGKQFVAGDYYGCRDQQITKHRVERKNYYCKFSDGMVKHLNTDQTIYLSQGEGKTVNVGLLTARFVNGTFSTDDPEFQFHLDQASDLCSHEDFVDSKLTPELKNARLKTQVEEMRQLQLRTQIELERLRAEKKSEPELVGVGAGDGGASKGKAKR